MKRTKEEDRERNGGESDAKRTKVQLTKKKDSGGGDLKPAKPGDSADKPSERLKLAPALREAKPPCLSELRLEPPADGETVVINVGGGRLIRTFASTVQSYPEGRLAALLDAAPAPPPNDIRKIFVDMNPDRFLYLLDWYRYGEIHLPSSVPVDSIVQDACLLGLPDGLIVNGVPRSFKSGAAMRVRRNLSASVIARWRDFAEYYAKIVRSVQAHYEQAASDSNKPLEGEERYDFPPFVMRLCDENGWLDGKNIHNGTRARALALKLEEECGYICEFTDSEMIITLPSRLRGEELAAHGNGEDEEDDLDGMGDEES
eukprot:TRINITY_DN93346_c0_g1_i1.p1 TRINITY_DN93346_c0_g1~~TRINITY_DN93346_c0_g1_i1.p1  ORF type:complete len:316 (-),score=81.91 TRINITY_DN93346_c0_g1_i1:76-1023(-)